MIAGIVAEQERRTSAPSGPDYSAALFALDFVNGLYFVGGSPVVLSTMIDKPGFVSAGALQMRFIGMAANDDLVFIQGAALAAITTNPQATFVFDWVPLQLGANNFFMQDASFDNGFFWQEAPAGGSNYYIYAQDNSAGFAHERDLNDVSHTFSGLSRRRIAITRDNNNLRFSRDGLAVVTATYSAGSPPMNDLSVTYAILGNSLGSNLSAEQDINSMVVWPVVDDSQLPVLSAH